MAREKPPSWAIKVAQRLAAAYPDGPPIRTVRVTSKERPGQSLECRVPAESENQGEEICEPIDPLTEAEAEVAWILSGAKGGMQAKEIGAKTSPKADPDTIFKRLRRMRACGLIARASSGGFLLTPSGLEMLRPDGKSPDDTVEE